MKVTEKVGLDPESKLLMKAFLESLAK